MLPHQDKRRGQNDGHYLIPLKRRCESSENYFERRFLQNYSFVYKGGLGEKMYGGNDFFSFFFKNKGKEKISAARNKSLSYTDCLISITVILEIIFNPNP